MMEDVPARSRTARDLLTLAWSYVWMGQAKLQVGRLDPQGATRLRGRIDDALKAYARQIGFGTQTFPEQTRVLVEIERRVGSLLASALPTTTAERIAARVREVQARQRLADQQPDNLALRFEAAWEAVQLADLLARDGQVERARPALALAFSLLGDSRQDDPVNLRWRHGRARAWETLARAESGSGDTPEARAAAGRAVAIAEALARTDPAYYYDLACMLSQRGAVSSSESDATSAVVALRQAIRAGFENDHLLRNDPRLDGLRSRPDFPGSVRAAE